MPAGMRWHRFVHAIKRISRAQASGRWRDAKTTEPELQSFVARQFDAFRRDRRERLFEVLHAARDVHGARSVDRVERAITAYLGEWHAMPPHARQRPKFFYFPDLPDAAYQDPYLHPWTRQLVDAWQLIRADAQALLTNDQDFVSFLGLQPGQASQAYVGGSNPHAAWDAFFFYRHGQRIDANHAKCPTTSAVLDSLELCRVGNQAPEVCFSVIRPQSTIKAHHGVTNTRMVMHLPLIVPEHCALNLVDVGEHHWREGKPMMFDDTYLHEAWNRSEQPRLILLMDCWNPHLTVAERDAVKHLVECIDGIENATGR